MAEPKAMRLKNCTIRFLDGTSPTPEELEIKIDDGNLSWTETRTIDVKLDRGELDYLEEGDDVPCELTLDCRFSAVKSSSGDDVTPIEFLKKTGGASAYKSTAALCAADAIDVEVEVAHDCGTTIEDEIITFAQFTYEKIGGNFKDGTLSISGKCNVKGPTSIRTTLA
jgi:hypothetical protein